MYVVEKKSALYAIPWIPVKVSEQSVTVRDFRHSIRSQVPGCSGCFRRRVEVLQDNRWTFAEKEAWVQEGRWSFVEKEAWAQEGQRSFVPMKPWLNPSRKPSAKAVPVLLGHHSGRRRRQFSRCRSLLLILAVARSPVANMSCNERVENAC
jgi:hypothetical protein